MTEYIAVERLRRYIDECDCDELAKLIADTFGGECFHVKDEKYIFKPNEFYAGEFNDLMRSKK